MHNCQSFTFIIQLVNMQAENTQGSLNDMPSRVQVTIFKMFILYNVQLVYMVGEKGVAILPRAAISLVMEVQVKTLASGWLGSKVPFGQYAEQGEREQAGRDIFVSGLASMSIWPDCITFSRLIFSFQL